MRYETTSLTTRRRPRTIPPATLQMVVENFNRSGLSAPHSVHGVTLAPLLNYLVKNGVPFTLQFYGALGYAVRKGVVTP